MQVPDLLHADVGGRRISYRERGSGPALVFVHGMGGGSIAWETQYALFSDRYRVIGWDAPGYGGSDDFEMETPSVRDYVDMLAGFLDAVGVKSAHLVGHSFGGIMVTAFHSVHPARVLSLTLAQAVTGSGEVDPAQREADAAARAELVERLGADGFARHHAPRSLSSSASPEIVVRGIEITALMRILGYLRQFRALRAADIFEWTGKVDIPAMFVRGGDDGTATSDMAERITAAIPGMRSEKIDGIGHMIYLEHPERFNDLLEAILTEAN
ncbi:MAG: alpha/beta fold hydrolase [Alphaproteobacteria bacterium]